MRTTNFATEPSNKKHRKSDKYPSIEVAYNNGVGHPNCKCMWSIYHSKEQMKPLPYERTTDEDYYRDQKKKGIEREIRRTKQDRSLYEMIGNYDEVDKTNRRLERLNDRLNKL